MGLLKKIFKQRGQVSLLFALLMPIFILFLGATLDLGWYYLNVSRLQNAADAAAVAGAQTLVSKNETFKDYKNISLIGKYPVKVSNEYRTFDDSALDAIENVKVVVEKYVGKNLSHGDEESMIDSWTKSDIETEQGLYEENENFYYVVRLREEIRHFFLPGWFNEMNAPVTAIAMLSKDANNINNILMPEPDDSDMPQPTSPVKPVVSNRSLVDVLNKLRNENVIVGNWEVQNIYKDINNPDTNPTTGVQDPETGEWMTEFKKRFGYELYTDNWNQYQDTENHYNPTTNQSSESNAASEHRRTETINVKTGQGSGSSLQVNKTANFGGYYVEDDVASLNVDFRYDVWFDPGSKYLSEDWDLELGYGDKEHLKNDDVLKGYDRETAALMRIHSTINFDDRFKERSNAEETPDILWVRIESEPMLSEPDAKNGYSSLKKNLNVFNSVRQIIININVSNFDTESQSYRPVVIFYDGPERYSTDNSLRDSKPVIVNLNADFRGILYMPNSAVVFNGNSKNFNGFIVAKEYLQLKTETDFVQDPSDGRYYTDLADKTNEYFKVEETKNGITNTMFIDSKGEVQYESSAPNFSRKYGTYDPLGRTDLTTYNYQVKPESANNLLLVSEEE